MGHQQGAVVLLAPYIRGVEWDFRTLAAKAVPMRVMIVIAEKRILKVTLSIVDLVKQMNPRWFACPISEMLHPFYMYDSSSPGNWCSSISRDGLPIPN